VGKVQGVDPPRFIGFIRDITLRKQSRRAAAPQRGRTALAQKLANLGNYVMHLDASETADYFSPQLHRILGVGPDDERRIVRARVLEQWVHPADRKARIRGVPRHRRRAGAFDIEYRSCWQTAASSTCITSPRR
jgi:two-component system, LuxR family, sensor kinase FixL